MSCLVIQISWESSMMAVSAFAKQSNFTAVQRLGQYSLQKRTLNFSPPWLAFCNFSRAARAPGVGVSPT